MNVIEDLVTVMGDLLTAVGDLLGGLLTTVRDDVLAAVPEWLWWTVAVGLPLLAAVTLLVADRFARPPHRRTTRGVSVGAAVGAALAAVGGIWTGGVLDVVWIPALGVRLDLAVDGLSAPLVLLTVLVGVVATLLPYHPPLEDGPGRGRTGPGPEDTARGPEDTARGPEDTARGPEDTARGPDDTAPVPVPGTATGADDTVPVPVLARGPVPRAAGAAPRSLATYHGCLLVVVAAALLTFLTRDAVVFFVAFELVLIPLWVLVVRHGDASAAADRVGAGWRFVLVTATGSTLMLVGILALATRTGTTDLDRWAELAGSSSGSGQLAIAVVLLLGLAVKVPVWPLHTWLPWVHATAPTAGSVLLAAVLLKMGVYGMVRLVVLPLPEGFATVAPVLAGCAVTGIVWAGLACLVERDLKRLIAWSSIAHLGVVVLALAAGGRTGLQAALFGNVAHGVVSALLFVVVGELKHQWGGADLAAARAALREAAPRLGFALVLGMAAALGLPGLAVFWGELGALVAAWSPGEGRTTGWFRAFAVVAALGVALGAAYAARVLREVWAGDRTAPPVRDAHGATLLVLVLLGGVVLGLGLYPSALLDVTAPTVAELVGPGGPR